VLTAKNFLFYSLGFFLLSLITYLLVADNFIFIKRELPFTYRQYLLESTVDIRGKVIIESGSNSIHGIAPKLLSSYFNAPVITIADNADYPLRAKIFNLKKFIQKGDTLLLPLEWSQYYDQGALTENFTTALVDADLKLEHYYDSLTFKERLRFLLTQFPFFDAVASFQYKRDGLNGIKEDIKRLDKFNRLQQSMTVEAFGNSSRNGPEPRIIAPTNKTCNSYLFHTDFTLSETFKSNLSLLKEIQTKGVNIYFTWPAVVNHRTSHCYVGAEHLRQVNYFSQLIKAQVEQAGFQFIGNFQQSLFSSKCFLNTHYHLKQECAGTRTHRLINALKLADVQPYKENALNYKRLVGAYASRKKQPLLKKAEALSLPLDNQKIVKRQLADRLLFTEGWAAQESWGIWSNGGRSEFVFNVAPNVLTKKYLKLTIKGKYFNGAEQTKVSINGESFGAETLVSANFYIPSDRVINNRVNVNLIHLNHASPKELGLSADNRNIKFGLTSLALASVQTRDE